MNFQYLTVGYTKIIRRQRQSYLRTLTSESGNDNIVRFIASYRPLQIFVLVVFGIVCQLPSLWYLLRLLGHLQAYDQSGLLLLEIISDKVWKCGPSDSYWSLINVERSDSSIKALRQRSTYDFIGAFKRISGNRINSNDLTLDPMCNLQLGPEFLIIDGQVRKIT